MGALAATAFLASFGLPAFAAPPDAEPLAAVFAAATGGNNNHYCAILLVQEGAIRPSADNTVLTSLAYGGRPGEADVIATNASYQLSIDPVLGFSSAPAGAETGTVFAPSYSGSGATAFSQTPWNVPIRMKGGTTRVLVNFNATNDASGFPAGNYQADLTLRCE